MRKYIAVVLITSLSFIYLVACDGSNGNGEEKLNVYDVFINIESVDGIDTECPGAADLKMSLLLNGNEISGFAQLFGIGKIGPKSNILGVAEDGEFSLQPFRVTVFGDVPPDAQFPPSGLSFDFVEFLGELIDNDDNNIIEKIEGNVSGEIFQNTGDVIICDAEFTGEFSGEVRSPEGCVSRLEIPTLECPAEGFINQCQQYDFYFCAGYCEPSDGGTICVDFAFNASECEIIDCVTLGCPQVGTIHLEEEGGFMFGGGDHILHCG